MEIDKRLDDPDVITVNGYLMLKNLIRNVLITIQVIMDKTLWHVCSFKRINILFFTISK